MIRLLVFLGNPGKREEKTRHSVGFMLEKHLFPNLSHTYKFHSAYAEKGNIKIIMPLTYMNLSGIAVKEAARFYKLKGEEILVIHDDMELPFGSLQIQNGGPIRGHNGLRSIEKELNSPSFLRLRIGIGRPIHNDVSLYVSSPFTKEEEESLPSIFEESKILLDNLIQSTL